MQGYEKNSFISADIAILWKSNSYAVYEMVSFLSSDPSTSNNSKTVGYRIKLITSVWQLAEMCTWYLYLYSTCTRVHV